MCTGEFICSYSNYLLFRLLKRSNQLVKVILLNYLSIVPSFQRAAKETLPGEHICLRQPAFPLTCLLSLSILLPHFAVSWCFFQVFEANLEVCRSLGDPALRQNHFNTPRKCEVALQPPGKQAWVFPPLACLGTCRLLVPRLCASLGHVTDMFPACLFTLAP